MKKNILSITALACAVLALAFSIFAVVSVQHQSKKTEQLLAASGQTATIQLPGSGADCSLLISDWAVDGDTLTISDLRASVWLSDSVTCREARLVLYRLDEELDRRTLTLIPGEADGVLVHNGPAPDLTLPELTQGDELSLWLELDLSDGTAEHTCGAQWYLDNGQLLLVAG